MRTSSKAGLFLMELIIVIAFFSLASATCMRLFVYSHTISRQSHALNMAVNTAQSVAECFRATGADTGRMQTLLPGSRVEPDGLSILYQPDWQPGDSGVYAMTLQTGQEGDIVTGHIAVFDTASQRMLYELTVQHYRGEVQP